MSNKLFSILLFSLFFFSTIEAQDITIGNTTLTPRDIATGLQVPWEVTWGPDDHLWVTERRGQVLRIEPESGNTTVILNHQSMVRQAGESGMLGLALHPDFSDSAYVYVVYTYGNGGSFKEKLVRFEWDGQGLVNELTLLDNIPAGFIHAGSRLAISADYKLFMTVGDDGLPSNSQNVTRINGKLLRMNLDGSVPSDNPIPGSLVYSFGHRNQQGLCLAPNGVIYASEHGQSTSDEVNLIEPNRNYGWPDVEGVCNTNFEMTYCAANNIKEPMTEFTPCLAINDLAYYNHPAIPEFENSLLLAVLGGFSNNVPQIRQLKLSADGTEITEENKFFSNFGRLRDICINPHTGALILATNGPSYPGSGPNRLIEYSNPAFVATTTPLKSPNSIIVYPNPATAEALQIEVSDSFINQAYEIYSFSGQVVEQGIVTAKTFALQSKSLESGQYFVRIENKFGSVSRVFVLD